MDTCPSGHQLEISWGGQRATVVEVGGGIRIYEVGDRPVFDPYPTDTMCDGGTELLRSSPGLAAWPTGSTASTRNSSCPPAPNPSMAPHLRLPRAEAPRGDELDFTFTDLVRDADGRAWARLGGTDGRMVEVWADESYRAMELYTGDTLAAFGHHLRLMR